MTICKISKALSRRLAYLEASLERETLRDTARHFYEEERDALRAALGQLGALDEARITKQKAAVREKVLPGIDRRAEVVRSARLLLAEETPASVEDLVGRLEPRELPRDVERLVVGAQRALRVA